MKDVHPLYECWLVPLMILWLLFYLPHGVGLMGSSDVNTMCDSVKADFLCWSENDQERRSTVHDCSFGEQHSVTSLQMRPTWQHFLSVNLCISWYLFSETVGMMIMNLRSICLVRERPLMMSHRRFLTLENKLWLEMLVWLLVTAGLIQTFSVVFFFSLKAQVFLITLW